LDNWLDSKECKHWMSKLEGLVTDTSVQKLSGLEYWFNYVPRPGKLPPKKYKMVLLTILGLYPWQVLVVSNISPHLRFLHPMLVTLVMVVLSVTALTYLIMPNITKLFHKWL
jgi:uncharacterized protein